MIVSLIRHGSTAWNEQGRMQGRRDIPLSERGRAQVRSWHIPDELTAPGRSVRWISSPLARAVETAELLCSAEPPRDEALIEMDWGRWEGFTLDEIRARFGAEFARNQALGLDFRPPGGESPRDVLGRVRPWLSRIAVDDAPVVAVTHLGVRARRAVGRRRLGHDHQAADPAARRDPASIHRRAATERSRSWSATCRLPRAQAVGEL